MKGLGERTVSNKNQRHSISSQLDSEIILSFMDLGRSKQRRFKIDCFFLAKFRQLAKIILKMAATSTSFFGFLVPKLPSIYIYRKMTRFLYWVLAGRACSQKCEGCLNFFTFISHS